MHQPPDFPPVPKCFSHLFTTANSTDGELHSTYQVRLNHQMRNGSDGDCMAFPLSAFSCKPGGFSKADTVELVEEINRCEMNGSGVEGTSHLQSKEPAAAEIQVNNSRKSETLASKLAQQSIPNFKRCGHDTSKPKSPFLKLNSSLLTLQREMKDLRCLDISLFCQLLSLHEAIQDFKLSVSDRYSETGSEYSLGTASYMGSMSSLNDESDWGEDGIILNCLHDQHDGLDASEIRDETNQSASSLLKQITDLALRADEDF